MCKSVTDPPAYVACQEANQQHRMSEVFNAKWKTVPGKKNSPHYIAVLKARMGFVSSSALNVNHMMCKVGSDWTRHSAV